MYYKPVQVVTVTNKNTGEDIELDLYGIGALAEAVGRKSQCIRQWEIAGVIPDALFKDKLGRRLYTAEQIRLLTEIAEKCKIRQGYPITNTRFSEKVFRAWEKYRKELLGE